MLCQFMCKLLRLKNNDELNKTQDSIWSVFYTELHGFELHFLFVCLFEICWVCFFFLFADYSSHPEMINFLLFPPSLHNRLGNL